MSASSSLQTLSGDAALARGAREAGVRVVTGYPGSPSSGVLEALLETTRPEDVHVEWSTNEKVALEVAIGSSLAGGRALVCVKSVGMNVLVDPLMALNLTGVNAGLVILLGDDPGAYGSQNDQDTRPLASFAEIPLVEPSTPAAGREMMAAAFELSERFRTAVIVRETRSFSRAEGDVPTGSGTPPPPRLSLPREPGRFVPYPRNAVAMHRELHEKLERLGDWAETSPWNVAAGRGRRGIITAGFVDAKLRDVIGDGGGDGGDDGGGDDDGGDGGGEGAPDGGPRRLRLGTLYPLPERLVTDFLAGCDEVLVLEENEPFVETQVREVAHRHGVAVPVRGKLTGHVAREGELYRWQIQEALAGYLDRFTPRRAFTAAGEPDERPFRKDHCAGCPYLHIVELLEEVGRELGGDPVLVGDPGCVVQAAERLAAKYALGSAAAIVQGMRRAGLPERPVAVFGDSSFFHTGLPALINAIHNETPVLLVVLDNSATVTSGFQPNPGSGRGARGGAAPRLSIEAIAGACGVSFVRTLGPEASDDELRHAFREGLALDDHGLIVIRKPCEKT
ncbi:MAG: thiamine pyrophosphate-dependent enzyme [Planctomycetota bacterium]|nr:thiamine pyrophosphate-dependent enzyme [Planctomycetota bacterium]